MGEAKRRRDAGIRPITSRELVARLNNDVGADLWAEGIAEDPRWVIAIDPRDPFARLLDLRSDAAAEWLSRPYRVVVTVLRKDGRNWVSARVLDFNPDYSARLFEGLGEHAAGIHLAMGGEARRIDIAHATLLDQHVAGGRPTDATFITVPGRISPERARELFDLHDSTRVDAATAARMLQLGWPEESVRRIQALGGRFHPKRGSVTLPDQPGVEVRFQDGKVVVDVWTSDGQAP